MDVVYYVNMYTRLHILFFGTHVCRTSSWKLFVERVKRFCSRETRNGNCLISTRHEIPCNGVVSTRTHVTYNAFPNEWLMFHEFSPKVETNRKVSYSSLLFFFFWNTQVYEYLRLLTQYRWIFNDFQDSKIFIISKKNTGRSKSGFWTVLGMTIFG